MSEYKIRLGAGRSFYINDELIDLNQLYYDWKNSGRGDWMIHHAAGLYGYLSRTHSLIEKNGAEAEEKYGEFTLKKFHELCAILNDPSFVRGNLK